MQFESVDGSELRITLENKEPRVLGQAALEAFNLSEQDGVDDEEKLPINETIDRYTDWEVEEAEREFKPYDGSVTEEEPPKVITLNYMRIDDDETFKLLRWFIERTPKAIKKLNQLQGSADHLNQLPAHRKKAEKLAKDILEGFEKQIEKAHTERVHSIPVPENDLEDLRSIPESPEPQMRI